MPLVEVYDTVLIPALALAETHWHRGEINEERHKFIFQALKETVDELSDRQQERKLKQTDENAKVPGTTSDEVASDDASHLCILCLPARDEADEIAGTMLAQLLAMRGCVVEAISVTALASEMVDLVEQRNADVVCISAMPPAAATHARYLCKRLQGRFPEAHLVVGLWSASGDLNKSKERIGCGPTAHVVATLAAAQEKIHGLLQPLMLRSEKAAQGEAGQLVAEGMHR
jgi:methylmalonyl-CoA mutase cobalamin-binding subunit